MIARHKHRRGASNTPLQQTKPRSILKAFTHRVRGFAAERQDVSPRPSIDERSVESCSRRVLFGGVNTLRRGSVREGRMRKDARARGNEIAINSTGCSPRASARPLRDSWATEIAINSS
jgi:hypothetical protein